MTQQEIKRLFNERLKKTASTSFLAEVKEVQSKERTCTVEFEELNYEDVLLYSVVNSEKKGFVFLPKVGSKVMVTRIAGSNNLFVSMFSEVDKAILTIDEKMSVEVTDKEAKVNIGETAICVADKVAKVNIKDMAVEVTDKVAKVNIKKTAINVTKGGFTIINGGSGLLKTLNDLCDAIVKITVSTAVGPSSPPINIADFVKIKGELKKYLEG